MKILLEKIKKQRERERERERGGGGGGGMQDMYRFEVTGTAFNGAVWRMGKREMEFWIKIDSFFEKKYLYNFFLEENFH